MTDNRPEADRVLVARLHGEAKRQARWRGLTEDQEAAAVAALRELAAGRADLLAQVAGLLEGFAEREPDESRARQAAMLCRKAGADPEAIPAWIDEGRRRRAAARMPPLSGGLHGGGARPSPGRMERLSQKSLRGRAMAGCSFSQDGPASTSENVPLSWVNESASPDQRRSARSARTVC